MVKRRGSGAGLLLGVLVVGLWGGGCNCKGRQPTPDAGSWDDGGEPGDAGPPVVDAGTPDGGPGSAPDGGTAKAGGR